MIYKDWEEVSKPELTRYMVSLGKEDARCTYFLFPNHIEALTFLNKIRERNDEAVMWKVSELD